jgi:hypothetical protein
LEDLSRTGGALSEFEALKLDMRRLSRQQQMSTKVLDRMHESALEAIKSIREDKK